MPAKKKRATAPAKKPATKATRAAGATSVRTKSAGKKSASKTSASKTSASKTSASTKSARAAKATAKPKQGPAKATAKKASATRATAAKSTAGAKRATAATSTTSAKRATAPLHTAAANAKPVAVVDAEAPRPAPRAPPDPTETLAQVLAALALAKKAEDVVILHVTELTSYADYFVLASAPSERQVQAIARHVAEEMKRAGKGTFGTEGLEQGHWVLCDYGAVVLHVFLGNARQYYDLEGFWQDAPRVTVDEAGGLHSYGALASAATAAAVAAADADESPAFAANE